MIWFFAFVFVFVNVVHLAFSFSFVSIARVSLEQLGPCTKAKRKLSICAYLCTMN
jgi:hypothetical protein